MQVVARAAERQAKIKKSLEKDSIFVFVFNIKNEVTKQSHEAILWHSEIGFRRGVETFLARGGRSSVWENVTFFVYLKPFIFTCGEAVRS